MSDEDAFLRAIQSNPKDDAPRLVYADWLDERGDEHSTRKAQFLRMTARLLTARSNIGRNYWEIKLRAAAGNLESDWLAVVSKLPIEKCAALFEFRCPKRWENLRDGRSERSRLRRLRETRLLQQHSRRSAGPCATGRLCRAEFDRPPYPWRSR